MRRETQNLRWRLLHTAMILVVTFGSGQGEVPCPGRCRSCVSGEADCSRKSLSTPPSLFPPNTTVINLERNRIRVLGSRTFTRLPSLEELKVAGNRISILSNDAFGYINLGRNQIRRLGENDLAPLINLHSVDLRSNLISSVHPRAFKELTSLRYLYMSNNPIVRMPLMEFGSQVLQMVDMSRCQLAAIPKPLPASVTDLRLGHNSITQVNQTDLSSVTDLQILSLNDNQMTFFADRAITHLTQLSELFLRNNRMVYIPRNLPNALKMLYMDGNNIQEIQAGVFGSESELVSLSLQSNAINSIQPNTFAGMSFLDTINFQNNQIMALETDAFVDLPSLTTLMFSNNPLQRIADGAFRNLGRLERLYMVYIMTEEDVQLEYNFLPEMLRLQSLNLMGSPGLAESLMNILPEGHLTPLGELQSLDISYNTLQFIPPRVRELFPNVTSIPLDSNPLRCTHALAWLQDWMEEDGSTVTFYKAEEPMCHTPLRLRGRTLSSISSDEWADESEIGILTQTDDASVRNAAGFGGGMARDQPPEARKPEKGAKVKAYSKKYRGRDERDKKQAKKKAWHNEIELAKSERKSKKVKDVQKGKFPEKKSSESEQRSAVGKPTAQASLVEERAKLLNRAKAGKMKRKGRKGGMKGGKRRRGQRARKDRKGKGKKGKGRNRRRKEKKNRPSKKDRERKRRRRITTYKSKRGGGEEEDGEDDDDDNDDDDDDDDDDDNNLALV
ncbi:leucine-rich repeat-like protein [Plakobranchus ocellatus]|uniref:Leucine-rich repeat-like protein n=1 Tax=Plakobranchus ocellatus TaxID=259542 RepID=A0AAV3Z7C2_9GAST|nr:leucine-rich repeat-like protein [Plakobranchus ocellatus]